MTKYAKLRISAAEICGYGVVIKVADNISLFFKKIFRKGKAVGAVPAVGHTLLSFGSHALVGDKLL